MEGRRVRRFGRVQQHSHTLLPLRVTHLTNTISCWYCDFKSSALNQPLFRYGRKYARHLRAWFSIGIGFSLTALLGVSMILLWESARALHIYNGNAQVISLLSGSLFGFSPSVSGLSVSFADIGYMFIASIISVCTHEVGHALAAASAFVHGLIPSFLTILEYPSVPAFPWFRCEGIQMEYTAVFIAVLFPGALVAFNHELLQALPRIAALRIYCAGIWHNAAFCAVCALTLFLLPLILYPIFIHNESPMVLDVSSTSPLYGYLSTGDLIVSLDGIRIHNAEEWMEKTALLDEQALENSKTYSDFKKSFPIVNGRKGYCIPSSLIDENKHIQLMDNQTTCPNELTLFVTISCLDSRMMDDRISEADHQDRRDGIHCLPAKDIVTLRKCGDGWMKTESKESNCLCSEEESCLAPVQMPGLTWVEITYSSPYSPKCRQIGQKSFPAEKNSDLEEMSCGGTFVFIGDLSLMARSIWLTSYQPRWSFSFGAYFPNVVEKLLICTFHVSLTLALLNSLPVYFLDGESILETILCFFSLPSLRQRERVLQSCLLGGTLMSILIFLRIFFLAIL